jgi:putative transposase
MGVSLMMLKRTIHAKLILDRKGKRENIEREYDAWKRELQGGDERLYSATKQQAERFKRRVKKQNHYGLKMHEYPMILRRDCVKLQQQNNSIFHWWIRIPLHPESIWAPIQFAHEQEPFLNHELRECKLLHEDGEDGEWYVNITVQKQARLKRRYVAVLPVDIGIRKLATTIEDDKPQFYGKKVRAIRGHHYHFRRSVGKPSIIKKWRHAEQLSVA